MDYGGKCGADSDERVLQMTPKQQKPSEWASEESRKICAWLLEQHSIASRNALRYPMGLPIEALDHGKSLFSMIREALDLARQEGMVNGLFNAESTVAWYVAKLKDFKLREVQKSIREMRQGIEEAIRTQGRGR